MLACTNSTQHGVLAQFRYKGTALCCLSVSTAAASSLVHSYSSLKLVQVIKYPPCTPYFVIPRHLRSSYVRAMHQAQSSPTQSRRLLQQLPIKCRSSLSGSISNVAPTLTHSPVSIITSWPIASMVSHHFSSDAFVSFDRLIVPA